MTESLQKEPTAPIRFEDDDVEFIRKLLEWYVRMAQQDLKKLYQRIDDLEKGLIVSRFPITDEITLAKALGKTKQTIRRWREKRIISAYKIPDRGNGFTYLYNLNNVKKDLERHNKPAIFYH